MQIEHEIDQAINYCIAAIDGGYNENYETLGNDRFVLASIKKMTKLPYKGRNLGIGEIYDQGNRSTYEDYKKIAGIDRITDRLSWLKAVLFLYDWVNYAESEILESAKKINNDHILYNHIMIHIISNFVVQDDIESAIKYIPNFRETTIWKKEDNLDLGYLIILNYYARKGDAKNFLKYFKLSKPSSNRGKITDAKSLLVKRFTLQNKIENSIALCSHKNLGSNFYYSILMAFAEKGEYQELKTIFLKYPMLKQAEKETELTILVQAYSEAKNKNIRVDDDFEILFNRTKQVDRKLKCGDVKLQDSIFLDLGMASSDNKERVILCRKAIKNNFLKKALGTK